MDGLQCSFITNTQVLACMVNLASTYLLTQDLIHKIPIPLGTYAIHQLYQLLGQCQADARTHTWSNGPSEVIHVNFMETVKNMWNLF